MKKKIYLCFFGVVLSVFLISGCITLEQSDSKYSNLVAHRIGDFNLPFYDLSKFQIISATNLCVRDLDVSYLEVIKKDQADFLVGALLFSGPSLFNYKIIDAKIVESNISVFLKDMNFPEKLLKKLAFIYSDIFEIYKKDDIIYQSFENDILIQYNKQNKTRKEVVKFDKEKNTVISKVYFNRKKKLFKINYLDYQKFNGKLIPFTIEVDEFKYNLKLKIKIKDIKGFEND